LSAPLTRSLGSIPHSTDAAWNSQDSVFFLNYFSLSAKSCFNNISLSEISVITLDPILIPFLLNISSNISVVMLNLVQASVSSNISVLMLNLNQDSIYQKLRLLTYFSSYAISCLSFHLPEYFSSYCEILLKFPFSWIFQLLFLTLAPNSDSLEPSLLKFVPCQLHYLMK
jgi:hypothetical protein